MIAANISNVLRIFGTRGILAGLLLIAAGFGSGWLIGGPDRDMKKVLALGTSQRNVAAALLVGRQSFSDPKVELMVVVTATVGLIVLLLVARALAKKMAPSHEAGS